MSKDSKIEFQNSEEQLIMDSILDSIWSIDTNYKLKTFNAFFKKRNLKLTGFKAKKGALIKNINPEHFETFWKPKYDKVFLGESMIFEYLSPDKKYFEIKLYPNFKDDQIIGLTAIGIDLTKLIYARNQLKKSEERFRLFKNIGYEGIAIHQDGKTITSDNGKEFAKHQEIAQKLETDFYFADPYSPWQRGLNEYNNKLIRQYLPKKTDFNLINNKTINMIISKLNNRPRKLLGYKMPNEIFLANFNQSVELIN